MRTRLLTTRRSHVTLTKPMGGRLQTSRILIATAIVVALCAVVETTVMAALRAGNDASAATAWAERLSTTELQDAALKIQTYPHFYRRALMTALEPDDRAATWRHYLTTYAQAHPELDVASRALITRAASAMTPEVFDDNPPADRLAELASIYEVSQTLLGRRVAIDLFLRLGPDDNSLAALPISERATITVRRWLFAEAASTDCECTAQLSASCDAAGAAGSTCSATSSCEPVVTWPMCGLVWALPCNGVCTNIRPAGPAL